VWLSRSESSIYRYLLFPCSYLTFLTIPAQVARSFLPVQNRFPIRNIFSHCVVMYFTETIMFPYLLHWNNYWNLLYLRFSVLLSWVTCKFGTVPNWSVWSLCYICGCQRLNIVGKYDVVDWCQIIGHVTVAWRTDRVCYFLIECGIVEMCEGRLVEIKVVMVCWINCVSAEWWM